MQGYISTVYNLHIMLCHVHNNLFLKQLQKLLIIISWLQHSDQTIFPNHKQKWLSYLLDVIDIVLCPSCAECDLFPVISLFIECVFKIFFSTLLKMACKNLRAEFTKYDVNSSTS